MTVERFQHQSGVRQVYRDGKPVGTISVGGPILRMPAGCGKFTHFEMHRVFGPIPVNRITEEALIRIPKQFWPAFDLWSRGGMLVDGDLCILPKVCSNCKGTGDKIEHLGGRNWLVAGKCEDCDDGIERKEVPE